MAVKKLKYFILAAVYFALTTPIAVYAGTYGNGPYDSGVYGTGYVAPAAAAATTPSTSGSGQVVGSGPTAPGYQNIDPTKPVIYGNPNPIVPTLADTADTPGTQPELPPASSAPSFARDLDVGATGDDVRALQQFLNTHGFVVAASGVGSSGNETTYFGSATQAALAKWQAANGITPAAGYFGPKTRAAIGNTSTAPSAPASSPAPTTEASTNTAVFTRDLDLDATGDDVRALQQYLNAHGYVLANSGPGSVGNETTYFGLATQYQLRQLQKAAGITPAAGYFGPVTRSYIVSHP